MPFLDFLQKLPLPILCVVTVVLSLLAGWIILRIVRWGLRVRGWDPAKPINIPELVTVTSVLFALMLSFSAAGVWNDWQQAQGAVRREALALEVRSRCCNCTTKHILKLKFQRPRGHRRCPARHANKRLRDDIGASRPSGARTTCGLVMVRCPSDQSMTAIALLSIRQRGSVASRTTCTVVVAGLASLKYSAHTRLSAS